MFNESQLKTLAILTMKNQAFFEKYFVKRLDNANSNIYNVKYKYREGHILCPNPY